MYAPPDAAPLPRRGGLLSRFFPNPYEGLLNLTPEQQDTAQRQGLLSAGLALMAGAGQHPVGTGPNLGETLFGALQAGQQAAGASYENAAGVAQAQAQAEEDVQRRALWQQLGITGHETPAEMYGKLQQGFVLAMQSGQEKVAGYIAEMAKSLAPTLQGDSARPIVNAGYDPVRIIDPKTGELINTVPGSPKPAEGGGKLPVPVTRIDRATNQPVEVVWDGKGWRTLDGKAADVLPMEQRLTEAQIKAKAFIASVDSDIAMLDNLLDRGGLSITDRGLQLVGQGMTGQFLRAGSPQAQTLSNGASTLAEAWLRMTTGAAYTQLEWDNARNRFTIFPTDSAETVAWKRKNMRLLQNMLRAVSASPQLAEEYVRYGSKEAGRRPAPMAVEGYEELNARMQEEPPGSAPTASGAAPATGDWRNAYRFLGRPIPGR